MSPSDSENVQNLEHPKNIRFDGLTELPYPPPRTRGFGERLLKMGANGALIDTNLSPHPNGTLAWFTQCNSESLPAHVRYAERIYASASARVGGGHEWH